MRNSCVILTILLLATSCASPSRKELKHRLEKSRAETRILRKLVPSDDGIDLKQAGAFVVMAKDTKWGKGVFQVSHAARSRMQLMGNWANAPIYSFDLLNVQLENNKLVADGTHAPPKGMPTAKDIPLPPKNISITIVVDEYTGIGKFADHYKAVFNGTLQIEEKP